MSTRIGLDRPHDRAWVEREQSIVAAQRCTSYHMRTSIHDRQQRTPERSTDGSRPGTPPRTAQSSAARLSPWTKQCWRWHARTLLAAEAGPEISVGTRAATQRLDADRDIDPVDQQASERASFALEPCTADDHRLDIVSTAVGAWRRTRRRLGWIGLSLSLSFSLSLSRIGASCHCLTSSLVRMCMQHGHPPSA